jgi:hypothetical protein
MEQVTDFGFCFPQVRLTINDSHHFRSREWLDTNGYREDFDSWWIGRYEQYVPVYTTHTYNDGTIRHWVRRTIADSISMPLKDKAVVLFKHGNELRAMVLGNHTVDDSVIVVWPTCDAYKLCATLMSKTIEFRKQLTIKNVKDTLYEIFGYDIVHIR